MSFHKRFTPGETVVMRGIWKNKLWWACPVFVVQDTSELLAYYWPVGTPTKSPVRRPTVEDELYNRIEVGDRNWTEHDVLSLNPCDSAYSVDLMWDGSTHEFRCWYVHLQEPLRRSPIGIDTMDQMLDIVISPDRSWRWKDEEELNEAERIGVYSQAVAQGIRAEGERVIGMLRANATPFCDGWENWRPPVEWTIPGFPEAWEKVPL